MRQSKESTLTKKIPNHKMIEDSSTVCFEALAKRSSTRGGTNIELFGGGFEVVFGVIQKYVDQNN